MSPVGWQCESYDQTLFRIAVKPKPLFEQKTRTMNDGYRTLDLNEAAEFLRMSPAVLRQKARAGIVKGAKPGSGPYSKYQPLFREGGKRGIE